MNPREAYSEIDTREALRKYKLYLPRTTDLQSGILRIGFMEAPTFADFDYEVFINGVFDHNIEVKVRSCELGRWEHTKVPLRKHSTAEHLYLARGVKTYFVCKFEDCVGVLRLWEEPDKDTVMVARHDRGKDTDFYAMYKVRRFIKI